MIAGSEKVEPAAGAKSWRGRFARYAPLVLWMGVIFVASTGELSASNTSRIVRPLLLWLFPHISEPRIEFVHFLVRKAAHFTEYAVLAVFAARAFARSTHLWLRSRWLYAAALLVILYALSDEFHQSFVASRTASIYDSLIDMAGGMTTLAVYALWRARRGRRGSSMNN
ncbi:MAG TPA: VanZ family protein [Pyrinomonadaceae bacterium]|jgi:VanZ family protein